MYFTKYIFQRFSSGFKWYTSLNSILADKSEKLDEISSQIKRTRTPTHILNMINQYIPFSFIIL